MEGPAECWCCGRSLGGAATCSWCGVWLTELTGERVGSWAEPLLALARRWGIPDDALREQAVASASEADLQSLRLGLAGAAGETLYEWLGSDASSAWVGSDEYASLTALTMAADSAKLKMRRAAPRARVDDPGGGDGDADGAAEHSSSAATLELPAQLLSALRVGQTLVAEVPAPIGRRAWVSVRPVDEADDVAARAQGWKRSSPARRFVLRHAEYLVEHLDGYDYDIGMREVAASEVADEVGLWRRLEQWGVAPAALQYPWRTDFPE